MTENQPPQSDQQQRSEPSAPLTGIPFYVDLIAKTFRPCQENELPDQERTAEELLLRWSSEPPSREHVDYFVQEMNLRGFTPDMESIGTEIKVFYKLKTI